MRPDPQSSTVDEGLWTPKQAAAYFKISERWLRDSDVPRICLGRNGKRGAVRYHPRECEAFARARQTLSLLGAL